MASVMDDSSNNINALSSIRSSLSKTSKFTNNLKSEPTERSVSSSKTKASVSTLASN